MNPEDLKYTKEHEWIRVSGDTGVVGITDHAQKALGEVVYVELPKVGDRFEANGSFGNVESVKAVSELFLPVGGEVTKVNEELTSAPERVNSDPYGAGWMVEVRLDPSTDLGNLMTANQYSAYIKEE